MHRVRIQTFVCQVSLWELKHVAIDGKCLVYGVKPAGNVCACPERWFYDRFTSVVMRTTDGVI